jgi:iron complex transport system ATP-binding protein
VSVSHTNILEVANLGWCHGDKVILKDVSFTVAQGEMIGIIGPNGAGKTTLLRCIQHQIKDFSGSIHFKRKAIADYRGTELAKAMAVVAQQSESIFSLTLFDVVRMGLLPHKTLFASDSDADRHNIEQALEKVGLSQYRDKNFSILSGGEQQRALIARALVQGAQLLLMDEPTNHLDVYYQHQIMHLVKALKITVIMTVHDLNLAAQHCPRLMLIENGQLVADGNADAVLQPESLSQVFNLPCVRDTDPRTGLPRVGFYLSEAQS